MRRNWVFGRSKNVENLGVSWKSDERIDGQGWRSRNEVVKGMELNCTCVTKNSKLMEYFIIAP